jgi:predicted O-methyltransferase YrrM
MLVHMIRPKNILEIGTFTGYSAICLAEGLPPGGIIHTVEINTELEEVIRKNISDSGFEPVIKLYMGDAMNILRELEVIYDLVFIDADKTLYQSYYEKCLEKLCPGGFMVIDNVLWGGKVVYGQNVDKDTISLRKFNDFLKEDNRVEKVVLPLRDGLTLIRKLT